MLRQGIARSVGVSALFVAGCSSQPPSDPGLLRELARARLEGAQARTRAAELDQRLGLVEQSLRASGAAEWRERQLLVRLEQMFAEQVRVLHAAQSPPVACVAAAPEPTGARPPSPSLSGDAAVQSAVHQPVSQASRGEASATAVESTAQQVQRLLEQARGRPLTRDQDRSLRILLKRERPLDSDNPWPAPYY